jgi:predicted metal-dependent phosphoesterase TrpH
MKISIHIHSEYSMDAKQSVESIIEESRRLGYDAIAITDHNTVAGSLAAQAAAAAAADIKIITGAEFSTEKGHIIALFINSEIETGCKRLGSVFDFAALVSRVRQQGGLLFLAHPLDSSASRDHSFIARLDGYELINARLNSSHYNRKAMRLSAALKAEYPDKALVGGSDAHTKSEIKSVYFTSDRSELKEALLNAGTIHFKRSSVVKIRLSNMLMNKNKSLKYYFKQFAVMVFGLLQDLNTKIKGDSYEVIRVRKES